MTRAPIAVALDAPNLADACDWARVCAPHVRCLKVGLQTYLRDGRAGMEQIREATSGSSPQIFLDLKLHDIPNTVRGAARSVAGLAPDYLTVHASGGTAMIAAAAAALPDTRITAVTLLTSLTQADMAELGLMGSPTDIVTRLALLAVNSGAQAIVCSPREVRAVRDVVSADITLITPGVRPLGTETGDQERVATPQQALADGADLLVIGRPITATEDPGAAAARLAASLQLP